MNTANQASKKWNTEAKFFIPDAAGLRAYDAGDSFYEALITGHEGLSEEQSHEMNAKLILLLANQVGNVEVLREAIKLARQSVWVKETV